MLMKTLEINEKITKNQGVINTKLLISHLVIAIEYKFNIKIMLKVSNGAKIRNRYN